ncbi:MAG: hypothetical protein DMF74_26210 [Acidobacteria bacterium]|nr:MAG: hypothetical protein DMF74_26210 [Acidobacteriota bacterium]
MSSENTAINRWRNGLLVVCACLAMSASFLMAQSPSQVLSFPHAVVKTDDDGNKISIRSVLRIAGATRRSLIEIEVYSDVAFGGGNDTHVLHIGSRKFAWPRAGDATGHTLIFELMPEQFAKVKNGDEVRVSYGSNEESPDGRATPRRVWKFGKLDKSKIDK